MSSEKTKFKKTIIGLIPEEWEIQDFSRILDAASLRNGLTKPTGIRGEGVKMVNMGELFNHDRIMNAEMDRVPLSEPERKTCLLQKGDLLFARQSLLLSGVGKCSIFLDDVEDVTFEGHIIRARIDPKKANPFFFYYFFQSRMGRKIIEGYAEQVAAAGIRGSDLKRIPIVLPPLLEQTAIADFLVNLDYKIEINLHMNLTLEAIGQAVFKRWFVDFEFPNEEGKPYKSSGGEMIDSEAGLIPDGWRIGRLDDICEVVMGQSPPGESYNESGDGVTFFQGIRDFGFRFPSKRVYCTAPSRFAEKGDVLLSVRAPVGSLNVAQERCAIGRGVAAIRLKEKQGSFLYYLLLSTASGWDEFEAKGTVFGSAAKEDVCGFKMLLPPENLRDKFGELMESFDKRILVNDEQSRTLTIIRDSLLPRLMSGKIRVPITKDKMETSCHA